VVDVVGVVVGVWVVDVVGVGVGVVSRGYEIAEVRG